MSFLPIMSSLAGLIPGAGPALSAGITGVNMLSNMLNQQDPTESRDKQLYATNYTEQLNNTYKSGGMMKSYNQGGILFKQYDFKPHSKGGGKIDMNGNPNPWGIAELEKKENAFKLPDNNWYIFSDHLKFK